MCTVVTEVRTLLVFSLCDMLNLQCDRVFQYEIYHDSGLLWLL